MSRSSHVLFVFIATILASLGLEIVAPTLAMAVEPEPFEVPQWTPVEMTVRPDTCKAQYDGVVAEAPYPGNICFGSDDFCHPAKARVCQQYTRNKGWTRPAQCSYKKDGKEGDGSSTDSYHYYCYCMVEAIEECVPSNETDQTPARSTSKPKSSVADETNDLLATRQEMRMVGELGDTLAFILLEADELQHPNFSGPLRSGTHYVSSSSRADEHYKNGMRAYAKTSHTEEETIEALTSFEACIVADPNHVPCLWELGWVYYVLGGRGATIILWERVRQIDPNHEDVDEKLRRLEYKR